MNSAQPSPPSARWRERFAREARAERPDLSLLCLLIGAEADPDLDEAGLDAAQTELDRLAGLVPYRPGSPRAWAEALSGVLGSEYGFHGTPADYDRLGSSLLHVVLRRRRGLPILLSVVWMEVARRAGAPVHGVALPGHFVVGFGPPEDQVLADPFAGGRVLGEGEAGVLVKGATGGGLDAAMLSPAPALDVVRRVLNNITAWAAARPERTDVSLWSVELALLLPAHPAKLRYDRAQLLLRRGDFLTAAAEFEAYAEVVEGVSPEAAERLRGQGRRSRARLN
ncbi:transglutaminase-like domain-containing protein [Streptomyces tsukubensis]|uniref:Protein SirB1 N-terminal domain-containing protein n=1 Tax=Streptomyces tsukubensis TaxID=83656 RepID=A0A1V4ACR2_9ACTN|nr:transglutaminase-like domain-containing protein [Streptomyces tsukubensis]OON81312.1 hypothetical protein B1H18_08160 [Streptomyces tsukubensis]QFR95571.1 tetratricopeptide repeat protein [Streptomyces tsukubensis]